MTDTIEIGDLISYEYAGVKKYAVIKKIVEMFNRRIQYWGNWKHTKQQALDNSETTALSYITDSNGTIISLVEKRKIENWRQQI